MYGKRLRAIRESAGLSQKDFAEKTGTSQTTYSSYEREKSQPPFEYLQKVCSLFDCDMNFLLGQTKTSYKDLLKNQYDDFADLIAMGFSVDEAYRMERSQFERFGDMVMKLNYDDRKRVVEFVEKINKEHANE